MKCVPREPDNPKGSYRTGYLWGSSLVLRKWDDYQKSGLDPMGWVTMVTVGVMAAIV